jgi:hypothetical protein
VAQQRETATWRAKYPGLHALRHFYASWCINRRADGGLELPLKLVQARLGHVSIQNDSGSIWAPLPTRRRCRGDGGGREGISGLSRVPGRPRPFYTIS